MDRRKTGCGDGRRMELAQDRVQWRALVSLMLIEPLGSLLVIIVFVTFSRKAKLSDRNTEK